MISIGYDENIRSLTSINGDKEHFPLLTIGRNSYINNMNIQMHPGNEVINIHIGNYCSIAHDVNLLVDRNHDYKSISTSSLLELKRRLDRKGQIIIGHDVWIGNGVTIFSGVKIGNGAVIGASTIVAKDVPPYAIVIGNPMRILKYRFDKEQIRKLQDIRWWNWSTEEMYNNKVWFKEDIEDFVNKFYIDINSPLSKPYVVEDKKYILFIPDFNESYSIWEKVITEYVNQFSSNDAITLILRIEQDEELKIKQLNSIIPQKADMPDIIIEDDVIADDKFLFKNIDYFITTRSPKTMQYIDYADEFGVEILSGVDCPIFTSNFLLNL